MSWPIILVCVAVGYVLGRVRPLLGFWAHHSQLVEQSGRLGYQQRVTR